MCLMQRADRLKSELHFLLDKPVNKHTIFVEDGTEASTLDVAQHFDTAPELAERAYNRCVRQGGRARTHSRPGASLL